MPSDFILSLSGGRNSGGLFKQVLFILIVLAAGYVPVANAQWQVNEDARSDTGEQIRTAFTHNEAGYSLEVYKDSVSAIRLRFSLGDGLLQFRKGSCPTYQIDKGTPANLSFNNEPCQTGDSWVEYILGSISDNQIRSNLLLSIMNGNAIIYRYQLETGDYRESSISLVGSKRSMTSVIGENMIVRAQ
jgi:hypothetical protein